METKLRPVRMEIVQPTSDSAAEDARAGKLRDTESGKQYKSIDIALVNIVGHRVYFGNQPRGASPLCRSTDGVVPDPKVIAKQADVCAACPRAEFVAGKRSECKQKPILQYVYMKDGTAYEMTVPPTSVAPVTIMEQKIRRDICRKAVTEKLKFNFWDYRMTLGTEKVKDQNGIYFKVAFTNFKAVRPDNNPVMAVIAGNLALLGEGRTGAGI